MPSPVEDLLGYMLPGICLACILFGVTTVQTFIYAQTYPEDPFLLKIMEVVAIWAMETLQTGFCISFLYMYTVRHFGDMIFLGGIYWTGGVTIYLGTIIQILVLGFYIRRVWMLSNRSKILTAPLVFLVFCRFTTGLATASYSYVYPTWIIFRAAKGPLVAIVIGQGSSALMDVSVASILIYYLRKGQRGGWKNSENMASFLIIYIVNTGALTSIFSFVIVITMQYKLYANAFLGSLNARQHIRTKYSGTPQYPMISLSDRSQFKAAPQSGIEVLQEVIVSDDSGSAGGTMSELGGAKIHKDLV